jgi:hypothetical protein
VIKVNAAIGDEAGWRDVYFLPNALIENLDFINFKEIHKSRLMLSLDAASRVLMSEAIKPPHLEFYGVNRRVVPKVPLRQLLIEHSVASIGLLKVDMNQLHNISAFLSIAAQGGIRYPRYVEYRSTKAFTYHTALGHINELLSLNYRVYSVQIEDTLGKVSDYFDITVYAELAMNSPMFWGQKEPYVAERVASLMHPSMMMFRRMCFGNTVSKPDLPVSLEQWQAGGVHCHFTLREGSERALYRSHRRSGAAGVHADRFRSAEALNGGDRASIVQEDVISIAMRFLSE